MGLICREVLISLAETVYDPVQQQSVDGIAASRTDAARNLQGFFETKLRGGANEEARAHAKAALKLAAALQHKRTAEFSMAALCSEATLSVVNIVAILSGKRR